MELQIVRTRHPPDAYLQQLVTLLRSEYAEINLDDLRGRLALLPDDDRFFLALDAEMLIGYAHFRVTHGLAHGEGVELLDLIVSAQHRREGVGRRLMTAGEIWAVQAERAKLVFRADVVRTEVLAFFSALGYEPTSTSQEYVRDLGAARRAEAPTRPQ